MLPDFRIRVQQRFDIVDGKATMGDGTKFDANVKLPWGDECVDYPGCRLVGQEVNGSIDNPNKSPNDPPAFLLRTWEELPQNDRIIVGLPGVSYNQYGFQEVVITYIQLSDGTTPYTDTVGTSTAPAPYASAVLKTVEGSNDGTIRTYKLTYTTGGEMADVSELRFGGKLTIRTLKYLNMVPPTPSGYTLVGPGVEYIGGLPLFSYQYAQASGGGGSGSGGVISQGFTDSQGGSVAFNPTSPNSATGAVICTTRYITTPAITTNPVTQPAGFVLFAIETSYEAGYVLWETRSGFGSGIVDSQVDTKEYGKLIIYKRTELNASNAYTPTTPSATIGGTVTLISRDIKNADGFYIFQSVWAEGNGLVLDASVISQSGALVIYSRTSLGAAPSTPSATIGGTVTLFEQSVINQDGYQRYDYKWAEGDGQSSIETQGEPDGAIVVTLTTLTATATTPSSPGAGYYLISLSQTPDGGYSRNRAVYKKPPVTKTFNKKINFTKPGSAVIGGSPIQLTFSSPVTMDILAEVEVSYDTTQISDVPFTVSAYAEYYETYTPTDTGIAVSSTKALGGYLAGASGTSGTNSEFNGILCDSWSYQLGSSTPSSFSLDTKVLDVDNDPYLTATDGTVVYRRTKVSYDFS